MQYVVEITNLSRTFNEKVALDNINIQQNLN